MKDSDSQHKKVFQVGDVEVRVRSAPGLQGVTLKYLPVGQSLEVDPTSRTEADGYVWWQHAEGWSAERSVDGTEVYLLEVKQVVSAPAERKAKPEPSPAEKEKPAPAAKPTSAKKKTFQIGSVPVRVRSAPGLSGDTVKYLNPGTSVQVDPDSRTEADGYVWWQHSEGWSAERSANGKEIYLFEPGKTPAAPAPGAPPMSAPQKLEGMPDDEDLPLRNELFRRLPVDLAQIQWWQYYGNNVFGYDLWRKGTRWYQYSQGLHGGLDFGNSSTRGVLVYAGVEGVFDKVITSSFRPYGLFVRVGDYTIIYGHLVTPRSFQAGQPVGPDTVMGEIEFGGQQHLHLEVRYKEKWIVNPLLLMPEEMREAISAKFPPSGEYFYRGGGFNKWQTPLNQPVLELNGRLIGPHAK
jgi:hypothetical protein